MVNPLLQCSVVILWIQPFVHTHTHMFCVFMHIFLSTYSHLIIYIYLCLSRNISLDNKIKISAMPKFVFGVAYLLHRTLFKIWIFVCARLNYERLIVKDNYEVIWCFQIQVRTVFVYALDIFTQYSSYISTCVLNIYEVFAWCLSDVCGRGARNWLLKDRTFINYFCHHSCQLLVLIYLILFNCKWDPSINLFMLIGGRREDDWTCPSCGNVNFSFRTTCNMRNCTQSRPADHNSVSFEILCFAHNPHHLLLYRNHLTQSKFVWLASWNSGVSYICFIFDKYD